MTIHIIGFPDAIAQDLVQLLDGTIADKWPTSADCELCIIDQPMGDELVETIIASQRPVIIVGDMLPVMQSVSYVESCAKPFRLEALRSLAGRMVASHQAMTLAGQWQFYPDHRYLAHINSPRIELTDKESDLLHLLYQKRPDAIDKEQLLKSVWGYDAGVDTKTLETHIYRLRTKLEPLLQDGMELTTTDAGYAWAQK